MTTKIKEELYAINIKGEQRGDLAIRDVYYMVDNLVPSHTGSDTEIENIAMAITGDRLFLYFKDGSRMTIGYNPQKIDLFYRPIKKKDGESEDRD